MIIISYEETLQSTNSLREFCREKLQGTYVYNKAIPGPIRFSSRGFDETRHKCNNFLYIIKYLPELIEQGYCDGQLRPLTKFRNDNSDGFYYIINKVKIIDVIITIKLNVIHYVFGNQSYYMFNFINKKSINKSESRLLDPALHCKQWAKEGSLTTFNNIINESEENVNTYDVNINNCKVGDVFYLGDNIRIEVIGFVNKEEEMSIQDLNEKLENLLECGTTMGSLGPAPTPSMGQCTVSGVNVEGKSVKDKKKKEKKDIKESIHKFDKLSFAAICDSENDIINILKNKPGLYRILYDTNINKYLIGDGNEFIHMDLVNMAYYDGWYAEFMDSALKYGDCDYLEEGIENGEIETYLFGLEKMKLDNSASVDNYCIKYTYDFGNIFVPMTCENGHLIKALCKPNKTQFIDYIYESLHKFNETLSEDIDIVVKYLNRLPFEYANTQDIIYKIEGNRKFLIKVLDTKLKYKIIDQDTKEVIKEKFFDIETEDQIKEAFEEIQTDYNNLR